MSMQEAFHPVLVGNAADFGNANPTLPDGQMAIVRSGESAALFLGDGVTPFNQMGSIPTTTLSAEAFGVVADGETDNTAALQEIIRVAHSVKQKAVVVRLPAGVIMCGYLHWYADNLHLIGQGAGHDDMEHRQRDKAKVYPNGVTTLAYNGPADGIWIDRRPYSWHATSKSVGGSLQHLTMDGVTRGANKAGICIFDRGTSNMHYRHLEVYGATTACVDLSGDFSLLSGGDPNSEFTVLADCWISDRVVNAAGHNYHGTGIPLVFGSEYNLTNAYMSDVFVQAVSGGETAVSIENTDHMYFNNVRVGTGESFSRATDTGTGYGKTYVRYRDGDPGFSVGDEVEGATSGSTATVTEVRPGNADGFGMIVVESATGNFTAGENLQVDSSTVAVAEDRTMLTLYDYTGGAIEAGVTLTGGTSGETFVVDEVWVDPDPQKGGRKLLVFADSADVSGTFTATEWVTVGGENQARTSASEYAIGGKTGWATNNTQSSIARYNIFTRWFGALTFEGPDATGGGSFGNDIFGFAVVDPFSLPRPTVEAGAYVRVFADAGHNEHATQESIPYTVGGQPAIVQQRRSGTFNLANNGWRLVGWNDLLLDTLDAMGGSANSSVTVPAGVRRVKVTAQAQIASNGTGERAMRLYIGGSQYSDPGSEVRVEASADGETTLQMVTPWLPVSGGEELEVRVFQDSGGDLDLNPNYSWMEVEFA